MGFLDKLKRIFADDYESLAELEEPLAFRRKKYNEDYDDEEYSEKGAVDMTLNSIKRNPQSEPKVEKHKEIMTDISSCSNGGGRALDIVTIADTHGKAKFDEIADVFQRGTDLPHAIFLLGDVPASDLETILDAHGFINSVPIFGICGNHDPKGLLKSQPGYETVQDLDGKTSQLDAAISIGGLSGSVKYKEDDYYNLITQKESVDRLNMLPYVDILLTHDKPCFERPAEEDYNGLSAYAHSGLYGIGKYILEKAPRIVLHGHLHEPYLKKVEQTGTIVKCCYGVERFLIYV